MWITAGDKYTSTQTVNSKVTVTYPADLFSTVTFHDGSPISVADFVMGMIMTYDVGKPDSLNYDEALAVQVDAYLSHVKGIVIESTDPLVISTYDDFIALDAELMVRSWYPGGSGYGWGAPPWQIVALGNLADASTDKTTELAWSTDKAGAKEVEWLSLIAGPSIEILKGWLATATSENLIPFAPTMGQFVTADDATLRWSHTNEWFKIQGHFWIGTGPYYLNKAFPVEKSLTLLRNPNYVDSASRWEIFGTPMVPEVVVDGPAVVTIGSEAAFNVTVTFNNQPYPADKIDAVKYLVFDAAGAVVAQGDATAGADGAYTVTLAADVTSKLVAGSNKLEVVTTSLAVSIPNITDVEFVAK